MKSTDQTPLVYVVDDEDSVRELIVAVVQSAGFEVVDFSSGRAFLEGFDPRRPGCLVLDLAMPGMSGVEVQQELVNRHCAIPVICLTGTTEVPIVVSVMRAGAFEFLRKPFQSADLLRSIERALNRWTEPTS